MNRGTSPDHESVSVQNSRGVLTPLNPAPLFEDHEPPSSLPRHLRKATPPPDPPRSPGRQDLNPGWKRSRVSAPTGGSDAVPSRDVQRALFLGSVQESARGRRVFPSFVRGSRCGEALCEAAYTGETEPPPIHTHARTQGQNK